MTTWVGPCGYQVISIFEVCCHPDHKDKKEGIFPVCMCDIYCPLNTENKG